MNIWHDINPKRITVDEFVAVVEIPKNSKVKYELNKDTGILEMDRIPMQFKVKKGSMIWLAGSQRLVDVRMKDGKLEKKLKVSLNDFGFLPKQPAAANRQENDPDITAEPAPPLTEVLDGDRESLPE